MFKHTNFVKLTCQNIVFTTLVIFVFFIKVYFSVIGDKRNVFYVVQFKFFVFQDFHEIYMIFCYHFKTLLGRNIHINTNIHQGELNIITEILQQYNTNNKKKLFFSKKSCRKKI